MTHSEATEAASELGRLRADYPQFTFSWEGFGWHGTCWVAQRTNRMGQGVHTVITTDVSELRSALDSDDTQPRADRLTREQALRALL